MYGSQFKTVLYRVSQAIVQVWFSILLQIQSYEKLYCTATYVSQAIVQQDANILQSGGIQRFLVGWEVADGGQEPDWVLCIHPALHCPAIDTNILLLQTQRTTWIASLYI